MPDNAIYFPQNGEHFVCPVDNNSVPYLAPYGYFNSLSHLDSDNVYITYKKDGKPGADQRIDVIDIVTEPIPPNNWTVFFKNEALKSTNCDVDHKIPFVLTIQNKKSDILKAEFYIVANVKAAASMGGVRLINVNSPTANQTVPPNFSCSGNTDSDKPLTASLVDSNHTVFPGATVYNQDQIWIVTFTSILPGTYMLAVTAGSSYAAVSPIFVVPEPQIQLEGG